MSSAVLCPYEPSHRVEMVRLIYETGVVGGAYGYSLNVTPIARKLNPPLEPTKGLLYGLGKFLVGLSIIGVGFLLAIPVLREAPTFGSNLLYCVTPLIIGIVLILIRWARHSYQLGQWEARRQLWDKLYYCFEHDIVFIPNSDFRLPAKDLRGRMGLPKQFV